MENKESIELSEITHEQFDQLHEEYTIKENGKTRYYFMNDCEKNFTYGIYKENELIGFIVCSKFLEDKFEVRVLIKNAYRGKGISGLAKEKLIEKIGKKLDYVTDFVSLIHYDNESSLKASGKAGWNYNWQMTEMINDEGGQGYKVYTKPNPYYKNKKTL